jgi:hypothetical protein
MMAGTAKRGSLGSALFPIDPSAGSHVSLVLSIKSAAVTPLETPGRSATTAPTFSPRILSGTPSATASETAGWAYSAFSTSEETICVSARCGRP